MTHADMVDGFLNELEYQKQVRPNSTGTAALQWAHDEIARLRAALKLYASDQTWDRGEAARAALTPDK